MVAGLGTHIAGGDLPIKGIGLAGIVGVVLNQVLPGKNA
jgi:xanthine/uracil permease